MANFKANKNKFRGFGSQSKLLKEQIELAAKFISDLANGTTIQKDSPYAIYFITRAYLSQVKAPLDVLLRTCHRLKAEGFYDLRQTEQIMLLKRLCKQVEARHKRELCALVVDDLSLELLGNKG